MTLETCPRNCRSRHRLGGHRPVHRAYGPNLTWIVGMLRQFGHPAVVDGSSLDASPLADQSISLHTRMVLDRIFADADPRRQGEILDVVAHLLNWRIHPTTTAAFDGLIADTVRAAHDIVESGHILRARSQPPRAVQKADRSIPLFMLHAGTA